MTSFENQVFAITGSGSGIGRALAIELSRLGAGLSLSDINLSSVNETISLLAHPENALATEVDVTDSAAMHQYATKTAEHFGKINGVINNAGVTLISKASDTKREDFEWLMNINFWGVVNGVEAFLPYIKQAEVGYIVNMSSIFGMLGLPIQSAYNSSKFAVRGYTEALKMEMAGLPIQVACVHPGGIATNIAKHSRVAEDAMKGGQEKLIQNFEKLAITTPKTAAQVIIKGLQKKKRRILIGRDAKIMDWFARHFPNSYEKYLGFERNVLKSRSAH
jgi:NAD(P)-dependent dehydrogenase (short-subunit alcohol dehydrogenase family)